MVNDTRSAWKNKDELDDNSVEKELCSGKGSPNCSPGKTDFRKSSKETSSFREMTPTPLSLRKSKQLENPISPSSLPVTRKSERLEKQNDPSTLRRSDRDSKNMSSSSNSKQSPKEFSSSVVKRKKEKRKKNLIQVTMESEKAELDLESVGLKRRKMNARAFKALFKTQRIKEVVQDVGGKLEAVAPYKISHLYNGDSREISLEPMGKGDDISDECSKGVVEKSRDGSLDNSSGDLQKSICSLRGDDTDILGNDISIDSNHIENVVDGPPEPPDVNGLKDSMSNLNVKETFDGSERPTNCSTTKNMDAPESGILACIARLQNGAKYFESGEKCMQEKDITPSPSVTCDIHNPMGICVLCCKKKRVGYGSPEQELCSCGAAIDKDLSSFCTCKDRGDHVAAIPMESEKCCRRNPFSETYPDHQMDGHQIACVMCDEDGKPLCCEGIGCKRCYHLDCLDPPLTDALPGVWHCPQCVMKKYLFGVHSVSEGVESIWDVREVEVSNAKGMHRQKQYLVKYHGLAHVHNLWVSEKQLIHENHCLVSNFIAEEQNVRWSSEWTVPHRLLKRRSLHKFPISSSSADMLECHYEWLVKWQGLNYDHATWELDSAYFLSSALGQNLVKDYEIRHEKAKKVDKHQEGSFVELSELPPSGLPVNNGNLLKNVNELRECWFKCQNAVVFNDQEQAMTLILFILSMTETYQPFLVVGSSNSLSLWEAEFARVAPSVDLVVYGGNRETRKGIRASEFYEGGCVMLQVLLSSPQAVFEDIDKLRYIRWKAIVIVDHQQSAIPNTLKQIKVLTADSRIILVNDRKRDIIPEYLNILSLLDSHGAFGKWRILNSDKNNNPGKLKERLSHFIAYGRTSEVSKFVEYWVPVQISNYQLELYCDTLLSNSSALCSCSKNDSVGALRKILLSLQKCCDHPYLVDSYIQEALFAEKHPVGEILDIGIKASGKLHLLDSMLAEIKSQGLQVLILFQMIVGPGRVSIGDILDDFVRQRFGENTYERVDATVIPSKKQAAVNRFNKKETGQFVFLLENRACSSAIKLSTLDLIIIYDSDWNPANDLRSLQKISIDLKVEQIKVFRLYSSCTVEERALVLAKQNLNLDNNLQHSSRATSDSLLMWGASYQFSKLDEYHAESNSDGFNISSEQLLLNEVSKEFHAILSENCENIDYNPLISKVRLDVASYNMNIPMLGEEKIQLKDGVEPHIFWRILLDRKKPEWKNLRGQCPRNRKRVQCLEGLPRDLCSENNDVAKKCKRVVNENVDPASVQLELTECQLPQVAGSKGGPSTTIASNQPQSLQRDSIMTDDNPNCNYGQSTFDAEVDTVESEERLSLLNKQKSLHGFLEGEMTRLCQVLELSENVTVVVRRFLEYVIMNHDVSSDSPAISQAFQISLCWIAALISKQKVDKKHSFILAKQLLNFQCTEEQVNLVYSKMRPLKWMYLQSSANTMDSGKDYLLAHEDIRIEPSYINEGAPLFSSFKLKSVKIEMEATFGNEEHAEVQILSQQNKLEDKIKKIQKKCEKRLKKLMRRQQNETWELQRTWEEARLKLEADHKLESAVTRTIHSQGSVRTFKLKLLDDNFAKKLEEHNLLKDMQLKDLEAKQLAARNEESQKAADWLAEAKACLGELRAVSGPQLLGLQSDDDAGRITLIGPGNVVSTCQQQLEDQKQSQSVCAQGNDVGPFDKSIRAPADTVNCFVPTETLTVHSHSELGEMPLDRSPLTVVEQLNHSFHSSDTTEDVGSANLCDSVEQVSGEIRLVKLNEKAPTEVPRIVPDEAEGHVDLAESINASNKGVQISLFDTELNQRDEPDASQGHVDLVELSNASNKGDPIGLLDTELNQRDEPDASGNGGLPLPGQPLEHLEQTQAFPNHCGLLSQDVSQDETHLSLASAELLEQDAPDVEIQSTSQIEVATFELVDPLTLVQSNHETPVAGNCEQLHSVPVDVSRSYNQSPQIEMGNQNQDQAAEAGVAEELLHELVSQGSEDSQLHHNPPDLRPATRTANEQNAELFACSQNSTATTGSVGELPNQAVLPLGIDVGRLRVPSNLPVHPIHESASWYPTPSLVTEPLQNELERLCKEAEQLGKIHEDMTSRLKSDCEKEVQETITQIRLKYGVKIHDAQTEYRLKKCEIEKNKNKVLMNKRLAEAFRSKCLDHKPSWRPGMQQAFPSSFMQYLHQQSLLPSMRLPPGPCQPSPNQQGTAPSAQAMHQLLMPSSMRISPVSSQNVVAPPSIQAIQHGAPIFSGTSSRPPVISAITPAANPRVGGEIRSPAPHLQPFRPAAASSMAPTTAPSVSQQHPQQILPPQLVLMPQPPLLRPPHLPLTNVSQDIPVPQSGQPNPLNLSLPAMELQRDINQPVPMNHDFSPLPDIDSTFGLLEPSDFDTLVNAQCNQASSAVVANIVCLSDDD